MSVNDLIHFPNTHSVQVLIGDCIKVLQTLPESHFQTCVTSPPYFGLRDYGTATWQGGDPHCDHRQGRPGAGRADGKVDERWQRNRDGVGAVGGDCKRCGAIRIDSQIGLEPTPTAYVDALVAVFREVRRVLRDDGTIWLNIGDSYAGSGAGHSGTEEGTQRGNVGSRGASWKSDSFKRPPQGLKPKDLLMIPPQVALALQADGWWLRSAIVWNKPNPMPESVRDRPTSSYEMVYLLAKSERYYYDADAIREDATNRGSGNTHKRWGNDKTIIRSEGLGAVETVRGIPWSGAPTRNARNVWTITPQPCKDAHFATMPAGASLYPGWLARGRTRARSVWRCRYHRIGRGGIESPRHADRAKSRLCGDDPQKAWAPCGLIKTTTPWSRHGSDHLYRQRSVHPCDLCERPDNTSSQDQFCS